MKDSTIKLCRQLQKKPDVEGNQREVKRHKVALIEALNNLKQELMDHQQFNNSNNSINKEIEESNMFAVLAAQEKELSQKIKQVTDDYKNAQNEYAREQEENNAEITELRKKVNEAKVEKDLHIQYLERIIQGSQSCQDRLYK